MTGTPEGHYVGWADIGLTPEPALTSHPAGIENNDGNFILDFVFFNQKKKSVRLKG